MTQSNARATIGGMTVNIGLPRPRGVSAPKPGHAIEAIGLEKSYPGGIRALDGVSLLVPSGTIYALLGPNGAGKSTTVKILTTLSRADAGEARVAGLDVARDAARVRHAIGVVGQKPGFDPEATARENLELQAEIYGITGGDKRARVDELLQALGLDDGRRIVKTYSGGQQRRLDVALGLVHRPQVLFLDEPTTGLDPEARADMWREIERLARDDDVTVLLTTHYLEEADRLASQVSIIDRGRIVAEGTPTELKNKLRGDSVQVELTDGFRPDDLRELDSVPGISELRLDAGVLRARAESGARALPVLITTLERNGFAVASATISRPSLDDVYLRYAGRSFDEADDAQLKEAA
jgi:ABC-2 type transport system ATP-binding protein